jgi:rod shape determining protein RodA
MLCIQIFINIAMNLGLAPVVGLPLPLMSYGGSSILVTFIALGILVNIDRTRAVF